MESRGSTRTSCWWCDKPHWEPGSASKRRSRSYGWDLTLPQIAQHHQRIQRSFSLRPIRQKIMTAAPAGWLQGTFACSAPPHQQRLSTAIDRAVILAKSRGRTIYASAPDPRQRLWAVLSSIDNELPALAEWLESGSLSNLHNTRYSPQPSYHQVGLLVGSLLFPRISIATHTTWECITTRPAVGAEETLVIHPEYHITTDSGQLLHRIDTRISLQTEAGVICELYDECDPSSTHSAKHRASDLARRASLATLGIVPLSTTDPWLERLTERWTSLYDQLRQRRQEFPGPS